MTLLCSDFVSGRQGWLFLRPRKGGRVVPRGTPEGRGGYLIESNMQTLESGTEPAACAREVNHFRAWSISLTSFTSAPLGASSKYFRKSAFASAFFLAWMFARPR